MESGIPIEIAGLSKHFGPVTAVEDLSFTVEPGRVTGFLGPNGAGKTTTLRVLLGLERASAGTATFGGTAYHDLPRPIETVGAALDADFHPGRSARNHLKLYATAAGLPASRVPVVLEQVGIAEFADRRVGGFSLGMRQRLALAYTLLGDPSVFVLDEPINGLDPGHSGGVASGCVGLLGSDHAREKTDEKNMGGGSGNEHQCIGSIRLKVTRRKKNLNSSRLLT